MNEESILLRWLMLILQIRRIPKSQIGNMIYINGKLIGARSSISTSTCSVKYVPAKCSYESKVLSQVNAVYFRDRLVNNVPEQG